MITVSCNVLSPIALSVMVYILFGLGLLSCFIGIGMLVHFSLLQEQETISAQAGRLAQKGLAEEVAGLVGNASLLLNSLNDMVKTRQGSGVIMLIFGAVLMFAAILLPG